MKLNRTIFMLASLVTLAGCQTMNGGYSYAIIFMNTSEAKLTDLSISSGDWSFYGPASVLVPYAEKVHNGPIPVSPKSVFAVSWKSSNGVEHRETVDLRKKASVLFQGEIVFTIDGANKLAVEFFQRRGGYRPPRKP